MNVLSLCDGMSCGRIALERCQTVPEGYTKCLTRNQAADVLGDEWTVDIISHILSFIL